MYLYEYSVLTASPSANATDRPQSETRWAAVLIRYISMRCSERIVWRIMRKSREVEIVLPSSRLARASRFLLNSASYSAGVVIAGVQDRRILDEIDADQKPAALSSEARVAQELVSPPPA